MKILLFLVSFLTQGATVMSQEKTDSPFGVYSFGSDMFEIAQVGDTTLLKSNHTWFLGQIAADASGLFGTSQMIEIIEGRVLKIWEVGKDESVIFQNEIPENNYRSVKVLSRRSKAKISFITKSSKSLKKDGNVFDFKKDLEVTKRLVIHFIEAGQ